MATDGTGARPKTEKTYKSQGDTYRKIKRSLHVISHDSFLRIGGRELS